ncbi:hypothetical protein [Methanolobus sp.]|uniref:hypothetical protein n=1 Tax=Methanolobus sp. TaxID=1874737 RepID=UPI002586B7D0|nr:hypothetical protein [Methanolobus sp.]
MERTICHLYVRTIIKSTKEHAPNPSRPTSGPRYKRSFLPDHTRPTLPAHSHPPSARTADPENSSCYIQEHILFSSLPGPTPPYSDPQPKTDRSAPLSPPVIYNTANYSCDIFTKLKYVP